MLIVGIIAFIVVIVVVAYKYKSLLDKKEEENKKRLEGIKDGKYIRIDTPQMWIIVSNNKVEMWGTERDETFVAYEFFITPNNDQTKVNIDGEELYTYMSTNSISNQTIYLAQSSSGKIVFYNRNANLVLTPTMTFVKK